MALMNIAEVLKNNSYAGRGIMIGLSADKEQAIIAYFIMGRSSNSRNRIFYGDGDDLMIKAFDESKLEDPSLIIYAPLRVFDKTIVVTNGDQTDTIMQYLQAGKTFAEALRTREYEPDQPNFTPRISCMLNIGEQLTYTLSILKKTCPLPVNKACSRQFFEYQAIAGSGHFIHTYLGDGDPLPSYEGEPIAISLHEAGEIDTFSEMLWDSLNADNKVSLAVRYVKIKDGSYQERIINRNQ